MAHLSGRIKQWTMVLLALGTLAPGPVVAEPTDVPDLAGHWVARPSLNGRAGIVALTFIAQPDGSLKAELDMPPIEAWHLPIGQARVEAAGVLLGATRFEYDAKADSLTGPLSSAIVPKYTVMAEFFRTEDPPRPSQHRAFGRTNEPEWVSPTGGPIWSSPVISGETLLVGSDDGGLHALSTRDGRIRWSFPTGGPVRAKPAVDGDRVFVQSDDGYFYCLNAGDGALEWKTPIVQGPPPRSKAGTQEARYDHYAASATFEGDVLYTATLAGEVLALGKSDGAVRWRHQSGGAIQGTPVPAQGRVIFGSFDNHVYALDAVTGERVWRFDTGAPVVSTPALHGDLVIIGSRSYDLYALDVGTGEPRWQDYIWFSWLESSATLAGGTAYIGSSDARQLLALDAETGEREWVFTTTGSVWGTPAVGDNVVYAGSIGVRGYISDHRPGFFAVERSTGRALWSWLPERDESVSYSGFASSPAVDGDRVYVGGLDGRVYAFRR